MSIFYCDHCDQFVDSDEAPDFEYNESDKTWKCETCIENEGELK